MTAELTHYGVKGMKWGVRRAEANKANAGYSKQDRTRDAMRYSSGGVKRINRRLNKGEDLRTARKKETRRRFMQAAAVVAVYNSGPALVATLNAVDKYGGEAASRIAKKAQTNRGRATAAATMGLPSKPTNGPSYAKKNKGGAYNISSI